MPATDVKQLELTQLTEQLASVQHQLAVTCEVSNFNVNTNNTCQSAKITLQMNASRFPAKQWLDMSAVIFAYVSFIFVQYPSNAMYALTAFALP